MTFEQYVSEWLADKLSRDIKTVITSNEVSVTLDDVTDVNKYQRWSSLLIVVKYPRKLDSATVSNSVQQALASLPKENYINSCYVDTERAERTSAPAQWEYVTSVRILHRRRLSWQQ